MTRTTSGRELFIPHNMQGQPGPYNASTYSDSGYVGTSSNASSRYPYSLGDLAVDEPPDAPPSWSKAAHRTISAQTIGTISSFGDDALEVLPGR